MEMQGLIEVIARGMWEETESSNTCAEPNMPYWRKRAKKLLHDIWEDGHSYNEDFGTNPYK